MPRVPGSGFTNSSQIRGDAKDWKSRGTVYTFDQMPYVRKALATLFGSSRVDQILRAHGDNEHALDHKGYLYQPHACKTKKCNFQLVLHGCFQDNEPYMDRFGPMAAANDMVILAPKATTCWDNWTKYTEPYTGKDTQYSNRSLQPVFFMEMIKQMKAPLSSWVQQQNLETMPVEQFIP